MRIGFVGAGKVGFSLGKLFAEGGIEVAGYFSRSVKSAQEAAAFTGSLSYDSLEALFQECDALILTVPDGEIASVYLQLREYNLNEKLICHCSGSLSAEDAFPGIREAGAYGYSIHPLFPISSKLQSYRELKDAFFCLEGDDAHLLEWKALLEGLGLTVQCISSEGKARYHAGCVMASNLMCALMQEGVDLLRSCGFSEELALQAISPLAQSNMRHILQNGPAGALTGPVERNDVSTVERHLACLTAEERRLYVAASLKLVDLAMQKHPGRNYELMRNMLERA